LSPDRSRSPSTIAGKRIDPFDDLCVEMAAAIGQEVAALAGAGADRVQIDEPSILLHAGEFDLFADGIRTIAQAAPGVSLELYTYFGDAAPLYDKLQALPVDLLGLDFIYSPTLADTIAAAGSAKGIGFGLIDGRNTKLDDERDVLSTLERLLPSVKGARAYLNPSCGLEYLPRDRAQRKLEHLVAIAGQLG
jgi:5-methyltetrahydropteroyltriglutamate--homocysteine methyltransferase